MIDVRNLNKVFYTHTGQEHHAVSGLSFGVRRGEIYGLLGPNGAGKTTTLRMLAGLMTPSSGEISIDGCAGDDPVQLKERVGFLTANTGLYGRLSARETLLYFGELRGIPRPTLLKQIEDLIKMLRLENFADRRCEGLSTGEKQRVQIARTLVGDPPVLILDEPTNGLDVLTNRLIINFIQQAGASGRTIIVSTHHLDEVEGVCQRFGLMHKGKLLAEGTLHELQKLSGQRRLSDVFLALVMKAEGGLVVDGLPVEGPVLLGVPPLANTPAPQPVVSETGNQ
ncbi:MAG TPA: ABC transporter ATP-binding protein [Planctomycetota bacterium]|nr:ABC transporter ATP-binding protein [Planctomycetota bacterium]